MSITRDEVLIPPSSMATTLVGAAYLSLLPLVLNAMSVPVMAYLIRRLGPTGYGQWMVAISLTSVCGIFCNLGLRGAFIRSVAANPESIKTQLAEQLGLRLSLTILAAAAAVGLCRLLGYSPIVISCTSVGAIGLVFTTFATTLADLLQAMHRIKTVAIVNLISGFLLTVSSVVIASITPSPVAIAAAYLTGPIVSSFLFLKMVSGLNCKVRLRWDLHHFVRLLGRSRFFAAQQFLAVGSAQAETLILPQLVGINQFGFFTAGTLFANRLTVIPDGLCTAAYPAISRECATAGRDSARSMIFRYLAIAVACGIAIAIVIMLAAQWISWILFPHQPQLFTTVLRITIWSLPLVCLESVMGYALNAAGKDAAQSRVSMPSALLSLTISISLIATLGVTGACFSMILRPAVRAVFLAPLFIKTFHHCTDTQFQTDKDGTIRIYPQPMMIRKAG